jgi:hypothetical protein
VANGTSPFALLLLLESQQGLAMGVYFSGVAVAAVVTTALTGFLKGAPGLGLGVAMVAFLSAGFWVWLSLTLTPAAARP